MFYNVVFPGNSFVGILVIDPARAYTVVVRTCESPHGKGEGSETNRYSLIMAALCCLLLAGCEPSVQTDYPRDKIYEAGETIHVYEMDTGDLLLSLTPVGAAVYSDEEQIWELDDGVNSDGEAKTKPITIRQEVAITFTYEDSIRMLPNRPSIASISIARRGRAAGRPRRAQRNRGQPGGGYRHPRTAGWF